MLGLGCAPAAPEVILDFGENAVEAASAASVGWGFFWDFAYLAFASCALVLYFDLLAEDSNGE